MSAAQQLSILDMPPVGRVGQADPLTSVAAARECRAPQQQRQLLAAMRHFAAPVGADDLADVTEIPAYIVRTRLPAMRSAGLVVVDGEAPARG